MSTKELLYIEDFLGHEQYFIEHICETAELMDDEKLKKFVMKMEKQNRDLFNKFYGLL